MDLAQSNPNLGQSAAQEIGARARNAFTTGNFPEAERLCRKGLSFLRDREGLKLSSVGQAWLMNDLGDALAKQGYYREAAEVWEQCYRRLEHVYNPERPATNLPRETMHRYRETLLNVARKLVLVYDLLGDVDSSNSWNVQVFVMSDEIGS